MSSLDIFCHSIFLDPLSSIRRKLDSPVRRDAGPSPAGVPGLWARPEQSSKEIIARGLGL
jgi:hypothetical protein